MNRLLLLILIAAGLFLLILFAIKPELIGNIWLWLVGLSGVIVKGIQWLFENIRKAFAGSENPSEKPVNDESVQEGSKNTPSPSKVAEEKEPFNGVTLKLFRFFDSGDTTLGILVLNNSFFCYTLEDTHREIKVYGKTRIPAGTYLIKFRKVDFGKTKTMREKHPDWFSYYPELQNVPQFKYVYIHSGNKSEDTDGCILVANSIDGNNKKKLILNSRVTFKELYIKIAESLNNNIPVRIHIYDENWINVLN